MRVGVPKSGVTFTGELEAREAARFVGIAFEQFCKLEGDAQSGHVAHYRAMNQIRAVLDHEQAKENKPKKK